MAEVMEDGKLNIQHYVLDFLVNRKDKPNIAVSLDRFDDVEPQLAFWMGLSAAITAFNLFMEDMDITAVENCAKAVMEIGAFLEGAGIANLGMLK